MYSRPALSFWGGSVSLSADDARDHCHRCNDHTRKLNDRPSPLRLWRAIAHGVRRSGTAPSVPVSVNEPTICSEQQIRCAFSAQVLDDTTSRMSPPLVRSRWIGAECGEASRRLPPHVFAESVNSEGGHLRLARRSGKESEPRTEINFADGNKLEISAFSAPSSPEPQLGRSAPTVIGRLLPRLSTEQEFRFSRQSPCRKCNAASVPDA